ncbi:hypothetical protein CTAYLR_004392 [Chrysophaeum taylorii]|uniref:Ribosomal RNA-processing protein 8 n=1 Tax=Chrysophaeum taylorii TaxID=2483200 RepID=A0AAD7UN57_9STRA|nr:hypothetical protein CTAYLR_004392 [Chrysophaeum taylorii]
MGKRNKTKSKNVSRSVTKQSMKGSVEALRRRLHGSQFRTLNEELYTRSGDENFARFSAEPSLATAYHRGFREQTARWPSNPLDAIIASLKKPSKKLVIADFGCGEARLAAEVGGRHDVHSFDLVATTPGIVACNMAHTPLDALSVDVAVFCLALMGPSYLDFLAEARRVLKPGGQLKIAEVRSRFDELAGGVDDFFQTLDALGFDRGAHDASNSHFLAFDFRKASRDPDMAKVRGIAFAFKPCLYKRR